MIMPSSFKKRDPEVLPDQEYEIKDFTRNGVIIEAIFPVDKNREVSNTPHLVILKVPIKMPSGGIKTARIPMHVTSIKEIWQNLPNAEAAKEFAKQILKPGIITPGDGGLLTP